MCRCFMWLNFLGCWSTKDAVGHSDDNSKGELVLQLGKISSDLKQYRINDLFYSEENYLQKN